jgi:hypothetical protein
MWMQRKISAGTDDHEISREPGIWKSMAMKVNVTRILR